MATKFGKAFDAYYRYTGLKSSQIWFLFDGCRMNEDDTPEKLEMIEGDIVMVAGVQSG